MFKTKTAALLVLLASSPSLAQEVTTTGGAVAGKIITESIDSSGDGTQLVLTTPAEGNFVLTTTCTSDAPARLRAGGRFIADVDGCINFVPGIAIPPDTEITVKGGSLLQVSGVLSKR